MTGDVIKLAALEKPLPKIEFATGRACQLRAFGAAEWETYEAIAAAEADGDGATGDALAMGLLRAVLPDATDIDLVSLTEHAVQVILGTAMRKINAARLVVAQSIAAGNVEGAAATTTAPSDSLPSHPSTKSATSSPASPAPRGKRGGRSPGARTTKPSSPSPASSMPSASTP